MGANPETGNAIVELPTLSAFARETVTVDATVGGVALTAATYAPVGQQAARRAVMTLETAPIRVSVVSASAPTASSGDLVQPGVYGGIEVGGLADIQNFRAIRTTATSGVLQVTYYR